jgi:hypothetical protein
MAFALLFFLTFDRIHLAADAPRPVAGVLGAVLLSLVRAEGFAWALVLLASGLLTARDAVGRRRGGKMIAATSVLFGAYFVARYAYFGEAFANTVQAKVALDRETLVQGTCYVLVFLTTFVTPLLWLLHAGAALIRERRWWGPALALVPPAFCAYAVLVGGDFMAMGRLLVPAFAFLAGLAALFYDSLARHGRAGAALAVTFALGTATLGILPAFGIHVVAEPVRARFHFRENTERFRSETEQWEFMRKNTETRTELALALRDYAQPGDSLVCGAIGVVGYYTGLYIHDKYGLVTAEVAERGKSRRERSPGHEKVVRREFFLDERPTYMIARLLTTRRPLRELIEAASRWREDEIGRDYAPDYVVVEEPEGSIPDGEYRLLFVMRRLGEDEEPDAAWSAFDERLRRQWGRG